MGNAILNRVKLTSYGCRITAFVAALFLVSTGFQASAIAVSTVYTIDDTGSFINVTGGERFIVSLMGSGSYKWILDPFSSAVQLVDENQNPPDTVVPATIYYRNFTFEGKLKGNSTISLVYWDSWEGNYSMRPHFTLNVNVTSKAPMNPVWIYVIVLSVIIVVPTVVIVKWMIPKEKKPK